LSGKFHKTLICEFPLLARAKRTSDASAITIDENMPAGTAMPLAAAPYRASGLVL
jgi:hypothetical protein